MREVRTLGPTTPLPPPESANADGIVAVGGDLRPERLLEAYRQGIFPWYAEGLPVLWHAPDPRTVLLTAELRIDRSLRRRLRRQTYRVTLDTAFDQVIERCATVPRPGQEGTWITADMIAAYRRLHRLGYAHSAESWLGERLVGGVYGVCIGDAFSGESMFTEAPDASKVALVHLVRQLDAWKISLFDCQMWSEHVARLGASDWPAARFHAVLRELTALPTRRGPWRFDRELVATGW